MSERTKLPDRETQIALMMGAEERIKGYFARWMANPEFKAALHRYDHLIAREKDYGI